MSQPAIELVQTCLQTKNTALDLGNCGLSNEDFKSGSPLDKLLRQCTHLEKLILSNEWQEWTGDKWQEKKSHNEGTHNFFTFLPTPVPFLTNLQCLMYGGEPGAAWRIGLLYNLTLLENLQQLYIGYNLIVDHLSGLENLRLLQVLVLNNNNLPFIPYLNLPQLHTLSLQQNNITEIIRLEELTSLQNLFLDVNQIREIKELGQLANLQTLSLQQNQITEIKGLEKLSNLKELDLDINQITELKGLEELTNLQSLYLQENSITEIKGLDNLKNLQLLHLGNNEITEIKGLDKLENLQNLYLRYNKINEIKGLDTLENLQELSLSYNQINELKGLNGLASLQHLYIRHNNIQELKGLEKLQNLKKLYIRHNSITEIKGLEALGNLEEIHFDSNQITEIKGLDKLNSLQSVSFYNNPVVEKHKLPDTDNHLPFIREFFLRESSQQISITYPIKILMLGNHASGKSSLVNMITGAEGADSTHILRIANYFLDGKEETEDKNGSSRLPDAIFFDFGGQDFYHGLYQAFMNGGAPEGRPGLQIIVFNKATDKNAFGEDREKMNIVNYDRHYWLGQKKFRNNNDAYVIVQAYADQHEEAAPVNYNAYTGHTQGFYLSLANDDILEEDKKGNIPFYQMGRAYCKLYIEAQITKLRQEEKEADWYAAFIAFILNRAGRNHKPTPLTHLLPHYNVPGLADGEKLNYLQTTLTRLNANGLVLYYNIDGLSDVVWLHPQALVSCIQNDILKKERVGGTGGVIAAEYFETGILWDEKMRRLLLAQKMIFKHQLGNGVAEYIIPNYLPLAVPNDPDYQLFLFGLQQPDFIIKFNDFIPFGFINQLICFYGPRPDAKKFWRNQLLFTLSREARVLIQLDFETLQIKVHIQLQDKAKESKKSICSYLFYSLLALYWDDWGNVLIPAYEEIVAGFDTRIVAALEGDPETIVPGVSKLPANRLEEEQRQQRWRDLREESRYIPADAWLSTDGERFISYRALYDFKPGTGVPRLPAYTLDKDSGRINREDVREISIASFAPFSRQRLSSMKKIFISYSKSDTQVMLTNGVVVDFKKELEIHLKQLQRFVLGETWSDTDLLAGDNWDATIKARLADADIILFLVSANLVATDYVWNEEMPLARACKEKNSTVIVPIILDYCGWTDIALFKGCNALPLKGRPVISYNNRQEAYNKIVVELKKLLQPPGEVEE